MNPKKALTKALVPLLGIALLGACSPEAPQEQEPNSPNSAPGEFPESWSEEITIDVYDGLANFMGIQEGWFGKLVKDKFNMKLNIIAPNVAGGGDTLYNTRVSAGDLGDLIIIDKGEQLDELVEGGLVSDISQYYPAMANVGEYDASVQHLNEGKDGIYGIGTQLTKLPPTEASEGLEPTFGAYLRWDLYADAGYPEVGTLEDLLPVLKQMQEANPTAENGGKVYGLGLFSDWDGNMMVTAKQPATFYGYDELGFVLAKADGSDFQSIIDSDSAYVRSLRFYFEANQLGLVDPESTTQNYDTLFSKMQNGQILFSWWPWLGQSAFNTEQNLEAGKGFMMVPIADQEIFSYGSEAYGAKQVFAIGSKADDPERIAAFIDWLYSAEGIYANSSQTTGAAGPQGLTWDLNAEGLPELNEFGRKALLQGGADVPAEWGGGSYIDGASTLNVNAVNPNNIDPATGVPYNYTFWETYQESISNPVIEDWSARMDGAANSMEYLRANDQLLVAPGASYAAPADPSEIETLRNQAKATIVEYSWRMAFAANEAEFESLLTQMQETANGLGYEQVLEFDMANAKAQDEARVKVAEEFN
ncbi:ABC transporter substrate-binding protein [Tessaracoccus rhinocerotis]|uniref:ABC transporter substrate-binding protein n=1 Tax=Tessaracoccus rhinocerotis TaxID=1689449 RepID=A0A553JZ73_9ACTN|nr:ABC transporter substrate-binding protein [Tessaracoccus rhinocerotis]TRY17762.1 ABC transporter substrate-binding protein [Tessaracoccus rhinocerotis]